MHDHKKNMNRHKYAGFFYYKSSLCIPKLMLRRVRR